MTVFADAEQWLLFRDFDMRGAKLTCSSFDGAISP
jgi:hypothetical protein